MKKHLLIFIGAFAAFTASAQELNPGFEKLRSDGKPANWGSLTLLAFTDSTKCNFDSAFYFASLDAHSGTYALEMRNAECDGAVYCGSAHCMEPDSTYFAAGVAFNTRPAYFNFFYKMKSVGNDSGYMHLWMYNDVTGNTVADEYIFLAGNSSYEAVSVKLNYVSTDTPTRIEIGFSTELLRSRAHYGSRLLVDDLSFANAPLGVIQNQKLLAECYPNPGKGDVTIRMAAPGDYQISIADMSGREVLSSKFAQTLSVQRLPAGTLIYRVTDANGNSGTGTILVGE